MQDIRINQNTYRVRREFVGKMDLRDVIVESIRSIPDKKLQSLTHGQAGGIIEAGSVLVREEP